MKQEEHGSLQQNNISLVLSHHFSCASVSCEGNCITYEKSLNENIEK